VRLSQHQIALLWIAEGGNPAKADLASAISMAESSGDTQAGNSCCHGIYQFNVEVGVTSMKCALDPVCATRKAIRMSKQGRDWGPWEAYTNGAYRQFLGGSGLGPKTSKRDAKNRLVDLHLGLPFGGPGLDIPAPGPDINPLAPDLGLQLLEKGGGAIGGLGIPGVSDVAGGIGNIAAFFRGLGELILTPEGWLRLAKLVGGAIMFMWGLRVFIRMSTGSDPVKTGKSVVTKAVDAAALAATVK
jgi:Lysozyme like domain